jgi:glucan 1,3-beta-glucosidase
MPYAGAGYKVFRNVRDYGAKGNGDNDDWVAINRAISDGNRCGEGCSATSTKGAIIFFPPGNYTISKPIVQLYYTTFIGDPEDRPYISPSRDFSGMALIDTDSYSDVDGQNWWVCSAH